MARPEKTESVVVCVDADVLIAGLLSRTGASHAILVLGELGLLRLVLPEAAVGEVDVAVAERRQGGEGLGALAVGLGHLRGTPAQHRQLLELGLEIQDRDHHCLLVGRGLLVGRASIIAGGLVGAGHGV